MIYLDYAANTSVEEDVLDTFVDATKKYVANPNSSHYLGAKAKEQIDIASNNIAKYFNTKGENVIYTSGSSEANNLVLKGIALKSGNKNKKIIISEVEHSSIVAPANYLADCGFDVSVIPLNSDGVVDLNKLEHELDDDTILVSICTVDSELGTIQPLNEISKLVRKYSNCVFHTDATQAIGKVDVDYSVVDFITLAPHKFYGLNGFGALINRNNIKLVPLIHGGKSTTIYRSGTPVVANVIAFDKALEIAMFNLRKRYNYVGKLNDKLRKCFKDIDCININSPVNSIPNTLNISLINKNTKKVLKELEDREIYLSTTTACSLGNLPSKSVYAITKDSYLASNTIRISLSHLTKESDIDEFIKIFIDILDKN